MDPELGRVARRFRLPRTEPIIRVPGGLSNELWRVGDFAVKRMVVNAAAPDFVANVERAYAIERRAWAAGVPMPEPIPDPATGRALARVGGSLYRVHRWVDSRPAADRAESPGQTTTISAPVEAAELLATIHAAGSIASGPVPDVGWAAGRWGADLVDLTARIGAVPDRVPIVDSHRDLDPKNTMRRADGVLIAVDWDAAGPVGVPMEVVSVALDWSGGDPSTFADAVRAYIRRSGTTIPDRPWVFAGWVAAQGGWLDYNASHGGDTAVAATLADLRRLAGRLDVLLAALESAASR